MVYPGGAGLRFGTMTVPAFFNPFEGGYGMSEIYIKIDGIDGESKDAKHPGWIEALSLGYGVSQSSSMSTGGGGGVGKADFNGISFTHYLDRASPNLFKYCAAGKHIPTVEVSVCKSGGGSQEFTTITLTDVLVANVGSHGSAGSQLIETVHLFYSTIVVGTKEQNADGSMGSVIAGGWDVKQNVMIA
jgi:type VI secretion system secreted protein Hcp